MGIGSVEILGVLAGMLIPIAGIVMIILVVYFGVRQKERESAQRTELLRKIAESPGDAAQKVLEMIRQQENAAQVRRYEGMKLGGLITAAAGIGVMIFLSQMVKNQPAWLAGVIPLLVGAALFSYVMFFAPKK
jgi:hypothetical protein